MPTTTRGQKIRSSPGGNDDERLSNTSESSPHQLEQEQHEDQHKPAPQQQQSKQIMKADPGTPKSSNKENKDRQSDTLRSEFRPPAATGAISEQTHASSSRPTSNLFSPSHHHQTRGSGSRTIMEHNRQWQGQSNQPSNRAHPSSSYRRGPSSQQQHRPSPIQVKREDFHDESAYYSRSQAVRVLLRFIASLLSCQLALVTIVGCPSLKDISSLQSRGTHAIGFSSNDSMYPSLGYQPSMNVHAVLRCIP